MINHKQYAQLLKPFLIVGLGSLFYVYEFFLRVMPGALAHDLMRDLSLNAASLGFLSACFFYAYTPLQIPAGILCDRMGPKRALTAAVALCSIATLLFSLSNSFELGCLTRFLTGMASSLAFVGPLALAARWFPAKYFAMIAGLIQLMGSVGAIFGSGPVAALSHQIGWRQTLVWAASIGMVLAVLYLFMLKDGPETDPQLRQEDPGVNSLAEQWRRLKGLCKNRQIWWIGAAAFACWAPMSIFAELWGANFLMTAYHTTATQATTSLTWVWVAVAIGSPIGGWWSNRIQSRKIPLLVFYGIGILASIVLLFHHFSSWYSLDGVLFLFGLTAAAQPITFGLIRDVAPRNMTATAVGFNNMCTIAGATILQPLVGVLLELMWGHRMADGVPVYSLSHFQYALLLIPMASLLGLVVTIWGIKETNCRSIENP